MPLSTKERLQRRLADKKKAAGISSEAAVPPTNREEESKCPAWDNSVSKAVIDAAENCHRSLVEETLMLKPALQNEEFLIAPQWWSLHRKLTAISLSPSRRFQRLWREMVEKYDVERYYRLSQSDLSAQCLIWEAENPERSLLEIKRKLRRRAIAKSSEADKLLASILSDLSTLDCFALGAVCRRWHFVGRLLSNIMTCVELVEGEASCQQITINVGLRPSKLLNRVFLLSTLIFAGGININVESLVFEFNFPFLKSVVFCGVRFVSSQMTIARVNDKVRKFINEAVCLEVLALANVDVCALDNLRNRREQRSLDFRGPLTAVCTIAKASRECLGALLVSLDLFHRYDKASFGKFCLELRKLEVKAAIVCGSAQSNTYAGLSEEIFTFGFAELMPHLSELSLCNITFGDGTHLQGDSLDLLTKKVKRDSKLELFCLTDGDISEEAISNLQRCEKLQIIILLRCNITKARPDLQLMAGWHPNANLPSSLITDYATVPRWFKPTYFRVVRIRSFWEFREEKFVKLCAGWWTVGAVGNAYRLRIPDFCSTSEPELEAEVCLADTCWLQWTDNLGQAAVC